MDRTSRVRKRIPPRDQLGNVSGEVERETPVFFWPTPPDQYLCVRVREYWPEVA
jgi:hypothetical protein